MTPETQTVGGGGTTGTEVAIWARLLEAFGAVLTPEAAPAILAMKFNQVDIDRMNTLGARARAGALTSEEDREFETYLKVSDLLGIMKSKARRTLKAAGPGSEGA